MKRFLLAVTVATCVGLPAMSAPAFASGTTQDTGNGGDVRTRAFGYNKTLVYNPNGTTKFLTGEGSSVPQFSLADQYSGRCNLLSSSCVGHDLTP